MSPAPDDVTIRPLDGLAELHEAVRLQDATWGAGFSERVPASLMKVTLRLSGVVSGAFDPDGRMVGFVYGMTGLEDGRPVHWSDMLAVAPEWRDHGLGRRLKLHQRERMLGLGVERILWTFDPLESRNARLNLVKLGAVCREYVTDMYGVSDSPLHRGLGTDRFVVTWELATQRVEQRLAGHAPEPRPDAVRALPAAFEVEEGRHGPRPTGIPEGPPDEPVFRVAIPADVQSLKTADPEAAVTWRAATRAVLAPALGRGGEVRELVRDGLVSHYLVVTREARAADVPSHPADS